MLLVGHNSKVFDAPRLVLHVLFCSKITEFSELVIGFSDTLLAFRDVYKGQFDSFSQVNLVRNILKQEYCAHNALKDSKCLAELVQCSTITVQDLIAHSSTVEAVIQERRRSTERSLNEGN